MTFSSKIHKNMKKCPGDSKSEPRRTKWAKSEPKGIKSESKGTNGVPKGAKREPRGAKREPKGKPKGDQNTFKNRSSEKVAKKVFQGGGVSIIWSNFGDIFHQKSVNKSVRKSMPKKSWKLMKNQCENGLDIYGNFDDCLNVASPKNEFSRKGVPTETIIFMQ